MSNLTPLGELIVIGVPVLMYVLATIALVPSVARSKGRSGVEWFFVALFVTPLLALIALAGMPDLPRD
jgi:hypothetical protein